MKIHLDNLTNLLPDIRERAILDLGSGSGAFLIEAVRRGWTAVGLELNPAKVERTSRDALASGVIVDVRQGAGEDIPFPNSNFDFLNVAEVIEHVRDPKKVISEMYRVMRPQSRAYVSVHNRFGIYDTHFHLYLLGWMPRWMGERYITLLNRDREDKNALDSQGISEMHYFTYGSFCTLAREAGFKVVDIREKHITDRFGKIFGPISAFVYRVTLRPICFSTFHILLSK